jgi:hypothetical protein
MEHQRFIRVATQHGQRFGAEQFDAFAVCGSKSVGR